MSRVRGGSIALPSIRHHEHIAVSIVRKRRDDAAPTGVLRAEGSVVIVGATPAGPPPQLAVTNRVPITIPARHSVNLDMDDAQV